jgi:hypothetical protein
MNGTSTKVRITANLATIKRLGNWTHDRDFEVRAHRGRAVVDLRSAEIPVGDIHLVVDLDHATLVLLVSDDAVIAERDLTRIGRGQVSDTEGTGREGGRRIVLTGNLRHGEIRVRRGGMAVLSAIGSREFVADLRRARAEGRTPSVADPAHTPPPPRAPARQTARWMATGAIAGPVLFTVAWLVLGWVSPGFTIFGTEISPYSSISAGISGLGLGPTALYMNTAFVLTGLLMGVGVVGSLLRIPELGTAARWTCVVLLCLSPLGAVIDGFFTLESFLPHFIGAGLGFGSPIVSVVVCGLLLRRIPDWRRFANWLLLGSPLTLALTVLYFATFEPTAEGARTGVAGLTERILVVEALAWFAALGWLAFRRPARS